MKFNLKEISQTNIINFSFYFVIISLSLGKFIAELNLLFLSIFFLIYLKKERFNFELNSIFLFFLIFYFYICLNAFVQIDDNLRWTSYGYIRFILFTYIIYFFFKENFFVSKKFFFMLTFFFIIIICDSIFQFFIGKNFLNLNLIDNRVSGIFGDELILGSYSLKSFLIILSLIFVNKINLTDYKLRLITLFFLTFVCIYIAAERTSFILLLVAIALLFILLKDLRNIIKNALFLFVFFIIAISNFDLGQKSNPNGSLIYKTFNQITNYKFAGNTPNTWLNEEFSNLDIKEKIDEVNKAEMSFISHIHSGHYKLGKYLFEKNKLFGTGPRGFRHYCRKIDYKSKIGTCTTHPHNFFIQFMSELGIMGLLFYFSAAIYLVIIFIKTLKIKKNLDNKKIILILLISIIINFFPLAPSGDFFSQFHSFFNYLNFGILIFYLEREKFINSFKFSS